jgi:hypothetical protein
MPISSWSADVRLSVLTQVPRASDFHAKDVDDGCGPPSGIALNRSRRDDLPQLPSIKPRKQQLDEMCHVRRHRRVFPDPDEDIIGLEQVADV